MDNNQHQEIDSNKDLQREIYEKRRRGKKNRPLQEALLILVLGLVGMSGIVGVFLFGGLIFKDVSRVSSSTTDFECSQTEDILRLEDNLKGEVSNNNILCYQIPLETNDRITIEPNVSNSSISVNLITPSQEIRDFDINYNYTETLTETGNYLLAIKTSQAQDSFDINIKVDKANPPSETVSEKTLDANQKKTSTNTTEQLEAKPELNFKRNLIPNIAYNVSYNYNRSPFYSDIELNQIVDKVVKIAGYRSLPTNKLSISLIDLTTQKNKQIAYGSYADMTRRYPASIVKLFWMVTLFGQYEAGVLPEGAIPEKTLAKMIEDSDNEAASMVLDAITKSESGSSLPKPEINYWQQQRESVNNFFAHAGYQNLNISQKTFPIPYLQMNLPSGRDAQIRSKTLEIPEEEVNPIRNYVTTHDVARLLYEIRANVSVSPYYSDRMDELLTRDLNPEVWQPKPYNAIAGFLGESLPVNAHFASKMGWTFSNRNDAAIIASPDRQTHYILVVFGDDRAYYEDKKFLPEISKIVYEEMRKRKVSK